MHSEELHCNGNAKLGNATLSKANQGFATVVRGGANQGDAQQCHGVVGLCSVLQRHCEEM